MKNQERLRKRVSELLSELNAQDIRPFPKARQALEAPLTHGVYVIRDSKKVVVHVGRTVRGKSGLRQRLNNHLAAQSSFVIEFLSSQGHRLREEGYTFQFLEVQDHRTRALLEHIATAWHCPIHLGLGAELKPK